MSYITIVSGLPRTGTSLMMKMLEAGGIPAYTDQVRQADEDNPGGYYELEDVKRVAEDTSWMDAAEGRAFKMVSMLLPKLPPGRRYKVVFMERDLGEVVASQRAMLERMGKAPTDRDDEDARRLFGRHLAEVKLWLSGQPNFEVLYVGYADVMRGPHESAARVSGFFGGELDVARMASVVDSSLYRNRAASPVTGTEQGIAPLGDDEEEAVRQRLEELGYM